MLTFVQAYISCVTDTTCVTVTAEASDENQLTEKLRETGLRAKIIGINGRFHSARDYSTAAQKLKEFAKTTAGFQYPNASELLVPVRRNDTGELITGGASVTETAVESILLHTADWHTTVKKTFDAFHTGHPRVTTFAFEDNILPLSLSQTNGTAGGVSLMNGISGVNGINDTSSLNGVSGVNGANTTEDNLLDKYPPHSVAVVGMACRFPGAADVNSFWDLLESGVSMVREVPSDRFNVNNHRLAGYGETKFYGNFIDDPDSFDHRFFKKSGREAVSWDPEKRILLEVVYEALESSGYFGPAGASTLR